MNEPTPGFIGKSMAALRKQADAAESKAKWEPTFKPAQDKQVETSAETETADAVPSPKKMVMIGVRVDEDLHAYWKSELSKGKTTFQVELKKMMLERYGQPDDAS